MIYKKWKCTACGYVYDEKLGDEKKGFAPGTQSTSMRVSSTFCPDCGATKKMFEEIK